jgi:hypothetical protein
MRQHVTIAPLEENGRVAGILVTIRDVTARLARERESVERLKRTVPDDRMSFLTPLMMSTGAFVRVP